MPQVGCESRTGALASLAAALSTQAATPYLQISIKLMQQRTRPLPAKETSICATAKAQGKQLCTKQSSAVSSGPTCQPFAEPEEARSLVRAQNHRSVLLLSSC